MKSLASIILAVVVLLLAVTLWQLQWERVTKETGLSRQGQQYPWLAAQQLLVLHNKTFTPELTLSQFGESIATLSTTGTALLINESSFVYSAALDKQLLNWVMSGGHLLYEFSAAPDENVLENLLLQQLPVEVERRNSGDLPLQWFVRQLAKNTTITLPSGHFAAYIVPTVAMTNCDDADVVAEQADNDMLLLCQYQLGEGKVTLASSFSFMQNMLLDKHQHAALALALLHEDSTLLQVTTPVAKPWLLQLWAWNAPFLLLLLLTLILVLWRLSQRFGPVKPAYFGRSLSFQLHLLALSEFLQAHGDKTQLHAELVKDLFASYDRRFPGFLQWSTAQQQQVIAKHSGVSAQQIQHLLQAQWPQHEHDRLSYLQLWQQLRNSK